MKHSEFAEIVNAVADEEGMRLVEVLKSCKENEDPYLLIAAQIPGVAARTAAEIMIRSGMVQLDHEDAE